MATRLRRMWEVQSPLSCRNPSVHNRCEMRGGRFHFVDLLRGLAAMAVLVCHYRYFLAPAPDTLASVTLPYQDWLWPIYTHGGQAVMLFWVLSGFVFWLSYGERRVAPREFWAHRIARLYPLHLVTLLAMAGLQMVAWHRTGGWIAYGNNDLPHFLLQLGFASNWFTQEMSFNGPIWSVSVEVLVYFAFLLFLKRPSLVLALTLAGASWLVERWSHHPIALCSALFFAAVAIGMVAPRFSSWLIPVGLAGIGLTAIKILLLGRGTNATLVYLGSASLLLVFIGLDYRFRFPQNLRWFGLSTYSIYLLHMPLLVALLLTVGVVPLPVFIGLTMVLSVASYRWIEAPAQRAIRSFANRRVAPAASAT